MKFELDEIIVHNETGLKVIIDFITPTHSCIKQADGKRYQILNYTLEKTFRRASAEEKKLFRSSNHE